MQESTAAGRWLWICIHLSFSFLAVWDSTLLFSFCSLTSHLLLSLALEGEKKKTWKSIELHKMQLNPLFKCQGLEVRRGRRKFRLFSCVLSTQELAVKWSTSGFLSGWWEAGSVSCYLGEKECTGVGYDQQRCYTFQVFFFWGKKDTTHLVLSVLITLYCISTIKQIFISREFWYLENKNGGRCGYISDYFSWSVKDIQAFEKECKTWK